MSPVGSTAQRCQQIMPTEKEKDISERLERQRSRKRNKTLLREKKRRETQADMSGTSNKKSTGWAFEKSSKVNSKRITRRRGQNKTWGAKFRQGWERRKRRQLAASSAGGKRKDDYPIFTDT